MSLSKEFTELCQDRTLTEHAYQEPWCKSLTRWYTGVKIVLLWKFLQWFVRVFFLEVFVIFLDGVLNVTSLNLLLITYSVLNWIITGWSHSNCTVGCDVFRHWCSSCNAVFWSEERTSFPHVRNFSQQYTHRLPWVGTICLQIMSHASSVTTSLFLFRH